MQSSKDGMTTDARSCLAPSKSRSQRIWYLTVPRVAVTTVLLPFGQADMIPVELGEDGLLLVLEFCPLDDDGVALDVGDVPGSVVVIMTVVCNTRKTLFASWLLRRLLRLSWEPFQEPEARPSASPVT
jgi:hypothetical protein